MAAIVYRYGLLAPVENQKLVEEQLMLATRYYNTLIEAYRGFRAALRALKSRFGDVERMEIAYREANAVCIEAGRVIKDHKSKHRTTKIPPEMSVTLDVARKARKVAYEALSKARATSRESVEYKREIDDLSVRLTDLVSNVRVHSDLYWGTKQIVEEAVKAAAEDTPLYDRDQLALDPRFHRYQGEGAISIQLQKGVDKGNGATLEEVLDSKNQYARIERIAYDDTGEPMSNRHKKRQLATLKVRVGSAARTNPIWASFPMVMHRPLPEGARVKRVTVHRKLIAFREEWYVTILLDAPARVRAPAERHASVAIDLGWRKLADGVRVARFRGSDGSSGELVLDDHFIGGIRKANDLQSIRSGHFKAVTAGLAATIPLVPDLPHWLKKRTESIARWESAERLHDLAARWKAQRFHGDDAAYAMLEAWRYRDHHLWSWEASQRTGTLRNRKDKYCVFAKMLASRYETLVVEDFDLTKMAKRPLFTDEGPDNKTARGNRFMAAPSELRDVLVNAFRGEFVKVPAQYTTLTCSHCGSVQSFDAAVAVNHTCTACNKTWDQDDNACENMLMVFNGGDFNRPSKAKPGEGDVITLAEGPGGGEADAASPSVAPAAAGVAGAAGAAKGKGKNKGTPKSVEAIPGESRYERMKRLGREKVERMRLRAEADQAAVAAGAVSAPAAAPQADADEDDDASTSTASSASEGAQGGMAASGGGE